MFAPSLQISHAFSNYNSAVTEAHSQSPEQTQTRRLRINDMTDNHISNQTMTELTNTARLSVREEEIIIF